MSCQRAWLSLTTIWLFKLERLQLSGYQSICKWIETGKWESMATGSYVSSHQQWGEIISWYMSTNHTINRAAFVCLSVCLFVPYLLRGPLTDLRQTWWVYVGGPRNCPWGVLFRKGQRLDGSTGHFHFPLYYICASLTPHSCKRRLCCYCI